VPNASFAIAPLPFLLLASPAVATRALSLALGINAGQTTRELTPPEQSKPRELLSNTGLRMLQTTTSSGIARSSALYQRRAPRVRPCIAAAHSLASLPEGSRAPSVVNCWDLGAIAIAPVHDASAKPLAP